MIFDTRRIFKNILIVFLIIIISINLIKDEENQNVRNNKFLGFILKIYNYSMEPKILVYVDCIILVILIIIHSDSTY